MWKYGVFVLKVLFIVGLFWFVFDPGRFGMRPDLFNYVTPTSILEVFKSLDLGHASLWLGFAVVAKLLGITSGIIRWHLLLKGQGIALPFWYLAKCWFMGRAVGLFLPGTVGLDGYRLVESAVHTGEAIKCATVIAVEKLIGIIALGLLVFLTLPLVLGLFDVNIVMLALVLGVLFVFIATSFLLLMNPRIVQVLAAVIPTPGIIREKVNQLGVAITAYSGQRGLLLLAVLFGLGVHFGICLMYFGNAMAISGGVTSFWDVLFASPLVIVASVVAPTVSGAGVREAGFGMLLGARYGGAEAVLFGHLGLWVGEMAPFMLSIPLILFATRPTKEAFLEEAAEVREETVQAGVVSLDLAPEAIQAYRGKLTTCLLAGLFAGVIGGAAYGFGEAVWHLSLLGNVTETSAYWWAPLVYGLVLAPVGIGAAAALVFLYLLVDRFAPAAVTFGLSLGGALAVLVLALGRFKYQRDVLGEHAMALGDNLLILGAAVGIGLAAALAGGAIVWFFKSGWRTAALAGVAAYVLIVVTGVAVASVTKPSAQPVAFSPTEEATGPNIVLIAVDTLRADFLRIYNPGAAAETPHIDTLARDSVQFQHGFAQSSWTKASFGTIFSGMYPEAHTATGKASALPDELTTFPEALKAAGYFTKGYSNNPNITSVWNYDQGFVDYVDLKPDLYFGARASSEKLVLYDILRKVVNMVHARLGGRITITDYYQPASVVTDIGLKWLDSGEPPDDSPFFLFLHYMDPHDPFRDPDRPGRGYARAQLGNPDPEEYLEAFIRSYVHEIEYMDQHLGRLLDGFKQRGVYEDAIIIFTSDHGEEFYEHGGWWHGLSLYEEQIFVPFMIKLPGNQLGGAKNPGIARHVDLAPTIAQLAGARPWDAWQGQPLFTEDLQPGNTGTEFVYAHLDFEGILLHALRTMDTKLIRANEDNNRNYAPMELYDLITDPGEQQNLADTAESAQTLQRFNDTIYRMQAHILENRAEPTISEEALEQMREELESLGYLE